MNSVFLNILMLFVLFFFMPEFVYSSPSNVKKTANKKNRSSLLSVTTIEILVKSHVQQSTIIISKKSDSTLVTFSSKNKKKVSKFKISEFEAFKRILQSSPSRPLNKCSSAPKIVISFFDHNRKKLNVVNECYESGYSDSAKVKVDLLQDIVAMVMI